MIKKGLTPTLAEVRKIKTGFKGKLIKSRNGKEFRPPKKVEWFFITFTERDADGNLIVDNELMKKIGEKPKEIKIRLPFDSIDKNFFTQYQCYVGNKKICAGDGEKATRKGELTLDKKGYAKASGDQSVSKTIKCDSEKCPIRLAEKCKVSGILSAFLADCMDIGGVAKYRTHSYNAVSSILAALTYFHENTGGILQGLPLKLVMLKKTTQEHGTIAYPTVVLDGEEIMGLRKLALEEKQSRKMLFIDMNKIEKEAEQAGFFKDTDPEEEIQAEYYIEEEEPEPETKATKTETKKVSGEKTTPEKTKGTSATDLGNKLDSKNVEKSENSEDKTDDKPEDKKGPGLF